MMSADTSFVRYTPVQTRDFYRHLADRARALPGVASVALTSAIPLDPDDAPGIEAVIPEGYRFPRGQESVSVRAAAVDEHYFGTTATAIVRGRAFTADDNDGSRRVAIVNQEFAKTYWPDQDPIGKRIRLNDSQGPWLEVVGVAQNRQVQFHQRTADAVPLPAVCARREGGDVVARRNDERRCRPARGAVARRRACARPESAGLQPSDVLEPSTNSRPLPRRC